MYNMSLSRLTLICALCLAPHHITATNDNKLSSLSNYRLSDFSNTQIGIAGSIAAISTAAVVTGGYYTYQNWPQIKDTTSRTCSNLYKSLPSIRNRDNQSSVEQSRQ